MKKVEIFNMRQEWFRNGIMGDIPDNAANLRSTHVKVWEYQSDYLVEDIPEDAFVQFNMFGDGNWADDDLAEYRRVCKANNCHMSMSVGDCVVIDGEIHLVRSCGFEVIGMMN